ncbi:hypothetical protein [Marinobacter xestospongiae]|uniref:Uncharacterized protein n=1 Tax=Marinobacter xestospongiae TaxID=994319 RepID=A0ABU3W3X2_9GAMM|nr:hypothetical protein [Marinobacter xestospongiae]MDV2081233.1 hypothetical protein [Marinobacter xestospongiae]
MNRLQLPIIGKLACQFLQALAGRENQVLRAWWEARYQGFDVWRGAVNDKQLVDGALIIGHGFLDWAVAAFGAG